MATTRVSIEDYLWRIGHHGYHEEYKDGEVREKAMGGNSHGAWVVAIAAYFHRHRQEWGIRALSDLHVNVKGSDYRIGDVVIVDRSVVMDCKPLHLAPIAVFEILSPTDSEREAMERLQDYEAMGTPLLFLLDPEAAVFKQYKSGTLALVADFVWPERKVRFPFSQIASELD